MTRWDTSVLDEARVRLLGVRRWSRPTVIATTLRPIFDALRMQLGGDDLAGRHYWPAASSAAALICLIPQGSAITDLVRLCQGGPALIYLGIAGGLTDHLALGDVLAVTRAYRLDDCIESSWILPAPVRGPVLHADGLLEHSRAELLTAAGRGCAAVEMECWHAFATARVTGVLCSACVVISDLPLRRPFHAIDAADEDLAMAGAGAAVRLAAEAAAARVGTTVS